jgi:hypothetical protein
MKEITTELLRFIRGEIDPRGFPHSEHVRMGFELLRRYDFAETSLHYSSALRVMTARIGKPQAFHQTVTIAFLALIAERLAHWPCDRAASEGIPSGDDRGASEGTPSGGGPGAGGQGKFAAFAADNPDLMTKSVLARWYSPERLASDAARTTFLLPDLPGF